jgi:ABC-2 type transport system ATP-binding protein
MIEVEHLQKHFVVRRGRLRREQHVVEAVRDISFRVARGELVGYLGPNGAGKSTTIKMLTGILVPSGGRVSVAGMEPSRQRMELARQIGVMFGQRIQLWWDLPLVESFELLRHIYRVPADRYRASLARFREVLDLDPFLHTPVRQLSLGQRIRGELTASMLHGPELLFLDEPTIGLDPQTRSSIWRYIRELKEREDITIFLTTHYMDEAEYCDRIAIIDAGRLVALDTPEALKARVGKDRVQIRTADDVAASSALAERFGIDAAMHDGALTFAVAAGEQFVPRLFAELGVPIKSISLSRPSLDDVFMSFTGSTIRDAEATATDQMRTILGMRGRRSS